MFATVDKLATLLGRTFDATEEAQAQLVLALAGAAVQVECGQSFGLVTGDVVLLDGSWDRDLELPERPAVAVHSVSINGSALDASSWTWNGRQTLRRGFPFTIGVDDWRDDDGYIGGLPLEGAIGPYTMHWSGPKSVIQVNYDHGLPTEGLPASLELVSLSVARRNMVNPDGVSMEMLGAYQVQYGATAAGFELTDGEKRILKPLKQRAHA